MKAVYRPAIIPYVTFLLWPLLGLVLSIVNFRARYTRLIIWGFVAYFGYTFIISNPDMDANRYRNKLINLHNSDEPVIDLMLRPYVNKGIYASTDLYAHFITLAVSRVTDDFRILFAIIGLIYGFFYSGNLMFAVSHIKEKKWTILTVLLFLSLAFAIPFWNINGYRFYTAAHVFAFGLLNYIYTKRKRHFLWCLFSPLIHFSFLFPLAVSILYLIVGNRFYFYVILFFSSFLFSGLNPQTIHENTKFAPVFMQNKVSGYTSKEEVTVVSKANVNSNWYVRGHYVAYKSILILLVFIAILNRRKWKRDKRIYALMLFSLFLFGSANYLSSIPSMGRFVLLGYLFLTIALIIIMTTYFVPNKQIKLGVFGFIPICIFLIVEIRMGFDFIGLNTLFLNPLIAPFFPDSPALIEFVK